MRVQRNVTRRSAEFGHFSLVFVVCKPADKGIAVGNGGFFQGYIRRYGILGGVVFVVYRRAETVRHGKLDGFKHGVQSDRIVAQNDFAEDVGVFAVFFFRPIRKGVAFFLVFARIIVRHNAADVHTIRMFGLAVHDIVHENRAFVVLFRHDGVFVFRSSRFGHDDNAERTFYRSVPVVFFKSDRFGVHEVAVFIHFYVCIVAERKVIEDIHAMRGVVGFKRIDVAVFRAYARNYRDVCKVANVFRIQRLISRSAAKRRYTFVRKVFFKAPTVEDIAGFLRNGELYFRAGGIFRRNFFVFIELAAVHNVVDIVLFAHPFDIQNRFFFDFRIRIERFRSSFVGKVSAEDVAEGFRRLAQIYRFAVIDGIHFVSVQFVYDFYL